MEHCDDKTYLDGKQDSLIIQTSLSRLYQN